MLKMSRFSGFCFWTRELMIYTNTDLTQIIKEIPVNSVLGQTQEAIEGFFFLEEHICTWSYVCKKVLCHIRGWMSLVLS